MSKNDWNNPWGGGSNDNRGGRNRPSGGGNNGGGGSQRPPEPPDWDEVMRKSQEKLNQMFPGGKKGGGKGGQDRPNFKLIGGIIALLWAVSGIYLVDTNELGVVMRFGEFTRTTPPGINYHLPYPVETVYTPQVTTVNRIEVGFNSGSQRRNQDLQNEGLMITGDENIIDLDFEVKWKISDAPNYLFKVINPPATVKLVAESAMRDVIGKAKIMDVIADKKTKGDVESDTLLLMQETLDLYEAGIKIEAVNLLKADPPKQVINAFEDVQSAKADRETKQNEARKYANSILPRARGQAEQMIQQAQAYKQRVIADAEGQAARFNSIYTEYIQAPRVTRQRMYIEAMEKVMQGMNKVIIDSKAGGVLPFLPLQELAPAARGAKQ